MSKKVFKVDRKRFEDASAYMREINRADLWSLDLSEFFDGEADAMAKMLEEFALCGLSNKDLLTSDFYRDFNIHRRRKP